MIGTGILVSSQQIEKEWLEDVLILTTLDLGLQES